MAVPAKKIDDLTGLPPRSAFEDDLEKALKKARKFSTSVSVALLDVDLFGAINDDHDRGTGDSVLRWLGERLSENADGGSVYRYGGDAFAVLWPDVEKEQAFLKAEALRSLVESANLAGEAVSTVSLSITVSAGLAAHPDDGADGTDLVNKMHEAVYRVKVSGRNKVCLAREEKMMPKTSHYTQGQLLGLQRLAERESGARDGKKISEAVLLREALNDLLRKYNA